MNNKTMHKGQGGSLSSRVRRLVDSYWEGSVNRAAKDLGVSQSLLHRVSSGDLASTKTSVVDAFRRYLDVSADWMIGGSGPEPSQTDRFGRPLVAGVPRWRRVLERLELGPPLLQEVEELPYGLWRAAVLLSGDAEEAMTASVREALSESLEAWATLFDAMIDEFGVAAIQDRVQRGRALVRLGASTEADRFFRSQPQRRIADLLVLLESSKLNDRAPRKPQ